MKSYWKTCNHIEDMDKLDLIADSDFDSLLDMSDLPESGNLSQKLDQRPVQQSERSRLFACARI
jgi:hypothetical protein